LKIVLVSLLIIFLFILFIAAKSYDKQFLEANQKMDKIIEKIEKQNIKKTMENIPSNVSLS
jgi:archaellum component FlaF (FlaF/FlaG flagellin family)